AAAWKQRVFVILRARFKDGSHGFPTDHFPAAAILGRSGLRDRAATRHAGGRRHVSSGNLPALDRTRAVAGGLCTAVAPADRRPLWRQSQSATALLPVPGTAETRAEGHSGTVPAIARGAGPGHDRS